MVACLGVNKQGNPCSVSWKLSSDGYCKFHRPNAAQCLGVSRTSGQRCRIKWDLDSFGYCGRHGSNLPTVQGVTERYRDINNSAPHPVASPVLPRVDMKNQDGLVELLEKLNQLSVKEIHIHLNVSIYPTQQSAC